ncbi:MAG TPA: M48 family peptidase, partial [Alphaproteobacteria bacterium]|nr:M48 family peptidase [Alphaproteobacteria bacterium]
TGPRDGVGVDGARIAAETRRARMDRRTARTLLARLREDADRICARFGLRYAAIEAERANVKSRYGICYSDGTIKIRLRHATTGAPLKYSSLVSTLCHELAHLRHFDHSPRFHDFNQELLRWARREGIYRPGPRRAAAPVPLPAMARASADPGADRSHARGPEVRRGPEQLTLF